MNNSAWENPKAQPELSQKDSISSHQGSHAVAKLDDTWTPDMSSASDLSWDPKLNRTPDHTQASGIDHNQWSNMMPMWNPTPEKLPNSSFAPMIPNQFLVNQNAAWNENNVDNNNGGPNNGRSRKPYTITKPRESWSEVEHSKFV